VCKRGLLLLPMLSQSSVLGAGEDGGGLARAGGPVEEEVRQLVGVDEPVDCIACMGRCVCVYM
jgi:hypothetical protein